MRLLSGPPSRLRCSLRQPLLQPCARSRSQYAASTSDRPNVIEQLATSTAAVAAALLLVSPAPAWSQIETVSASTALNSAKPLQEQPYDKGKVWLLLVGGAAGLFAATVALENNEKFFPAIFRANQAMSASKQQTPAMEQGSSDFDAVTIDSDQRREEIRLKAEEYARSEDAVLRGLEEARQSVLAESQAVAGQLQESLKSSSGEASASAPVRATADQTADEKASSSTEREAAGEAAGVKSRAQP